MQLLETILIALRSLTGNRMRSALTMLGVVIGVAAVIAMIAIGQGANKQVTSSIQGLGTNLLMVSPGQAMQGGVRQGAGSLTTLTVDDANAIKEQVAGVSGVAAEVSTDANVVFANMNTGTSIIGTVPEYASVRNSNVAWGRFITEEEVRDSSMVAVVGSEVLTNLGAQGNILGNRILVNRIPFTVIGTLQSKGSSGPFSQDDQIIIPISTAMSRLTGSKSVRTINIAVKSEADMDQVSASVTDLLRTRHRLAQNADDDFTIRNQAEIMNTLSSITGVFTILLGGIASISLLVGGIGIMNIMLVSVTERTKEIGILKALGAKRHQILNQFMIESMALSGLGGIIGVVIGIAGSYIMQQVFQFQTVVAVSSVMLAFSFSLLVGIFFGVYPALKASRLHPIEALRFE
ncbi:MAG: ABC transporter permease [Actinobacteria bacterium]|nr:ABC transporter permease [Actinomycetota bacterium]